MSYVDGFVIPIPKKNLKAYLKMAKGGYDMWMKYGALDYKECVANDLNNQYGSSFSKMVKLKAGETVIFSYIVYKSKRHRNQVNKRVMKDIEKTGMPEMPFNMRRMVYGGFETIVE